MKQITEYILEKANFLVKKHVDNEKNSDKKGDVEQIEQLEPGDILVSSYSYNSRHVNFYKVKSKKGKSSVILDELERKTISGAYNSFSGAEVVPDEEKVRTPDLEARLGKKGLRLLGQDRYTSSLYFWTGKPEHIYCD